jgi:hypothetical protein
VCPACSTINGLRFAGIRLPVSIGGIAVTAGGEASGSQSIQWRTSLITDQRGFFAALSRPSTQY